MLADAIKSLGATAYARTRYAQGTYTAGRAVAGAGTVTSIDALVWPASGQDLMRLPEGMRNQEVRAVITKTALRADGLDFVTIDGAQWQVEHSDQWQGGLFFKLLVRRV